MGAGGDGGDSSETVSVMEGEETKDQQRCQPHPHPLLGQRGEQ